MAPVRAVLLLALCLSLAGALAAAPAMQGNFELRKLEVALALYPDGTAHAVETMRIFMNNTQSIQLYQDTMQSNDLSTWVSRTGINDLRTHVNSASVAVGNLEVRSQSPDNCNSLIGICFATLVLEYDVRPLSNSSTGIMVMEDYKPRTTRYTFQSDALLLPRSSSGDIRRTPSTTLRLILPDGADDIRFSQMPNNLLDETGRFRYDPSQGYSGPERQFTWTDQTLSKFSVVFDREAPLQSEILGYFSRLQKGVFETAFSFNGLAVLLVCAVLLISVLWVHQMHLK